MTTSQYTLLAKALEANQGTDLTDWKFAGNHVPMTFTALTTLLEELILKATSPVEKKGDDGGIEVVAAATRRIFDRYSKETVPMLYQRPLPPWGAQQVSEKLDISESTLQQHRGQVKCTTQVAAYFVKQMQTSLKGESDGDQNKGVQLWLQHIYNQQGGNCGEVGLSTHAFHPLLRLGFAISLLSINPSVSNDSNLYSVVNQEIAHALANMVTATYNDGGLLEKMVTRGAQDEKISSNNTNKNDGKEDIAQVVHSTWKALLEALPTDISPSIPDLGKLGSIDLRIQAIWEIPKYQEIMRKCCQSVLALYGVDDDLMHMLEDDGQKKPKKDEKEISSQEKKRIFLQAVAEIAVDAFSKTPDFTLLHGFTSSVAMQQLLAFPVVVKKEEEEGKSNHVPSSLVSIEMILSYWMSVTGAALAVVHMRTVGGHVSAPPPQLKAPTAGGNVSTAMSATSEWMAIVSRLLLVIDENFSTLTSTQVEHMTKCVWACWYADTRLAGVYTVGGGEKQGAMSATLKGIACREIGAPSPF